MTGNQNVQTSQGTMPVRKINYPNQFFSLSEYYFPAEVKKLFYWCKYFFYKDPLIGSTVKKMASYPVTDLIYSPEDDNENVKKVYKYALEDIMNIRSVMFNAGIAYFTFGNSIKSVYFPFSRNLICTKCGTRIDITNNTNRDADWRFEVKNSKPAFNLKCQKCQHNGQAIIDDVAMPNIKAMNIIHWDVEDIDILYYEVTGKSRYFYNPSKEKRNRIRKRRDQDRYILRTYPLEFLEAMSTNQAIELDSNNLIHFKNFTLPDSDQGWGKPLIIHSLQRLFYIYTLRRANEAIAIERIIPLDIFSPPAGNSMEFFQKVAYQEWARVINHAFEMKRNDPNYKAVIPHPVQHQRVGGDGRALMTHQEVQEAEKEVIAGMGVPLEFAFGGLSWTGSSITLRMLENFFEGHRSDLQRLINFLRDAVRQVVSLPPCNIEMSKLIMADDIQRQQLDMQLYSMQLLSGQTLMNNIGRDLREEWDKMNTELPQRAKLLGRQARDDAESQGEAQVISAQQQARASIEGQKLMNQGQREIDNSLPDVQRKAKEVSDLGQFLQYYLMYKQMVDEAAGMAPPPPPPGQEQGGPPPEEGGGGQAPPEGEQGAPPPEQQGGGQQQLPAGQVEPQGGPEVPAVNEQQYGNPFYGASGGTATPDLEAILKRRATIISQMPTQERMQALAAIRKDSPKMHRNIMSYLTLTPQGGTASDANRVY